MSASRWIVALVSCVLLATGCESAVVGSECAAPFVRCGHYCVDLQTDGLNCGFCANQCVIGCASGTCITLDASMPHDGGRDAGHRDAGNDASAIDAGNDAGDGGPSDASGQDANVDGGGPRCRIGESLCGTSCVDPRDAAHCGDCSTTCSGADVCLDGACAPDCGALTACGTRCVDTTRDVHHCGDCSTDCGMQSCITSACTTASPGHLVVIGHDFETRRFAMSTILGNAILLTARPTVRVLAYEVDASAASIAGTDAAIAESTGAGPVTITVAPAADDVPVLLDGSDTFVVYAQANASDVTLQSLGYAWRDALSEFLERGGVLIVLEAPSLTNRGTYQILQQAGLFNAVSVSELVMPRLVAASGRASDPVLATVSFPYVGERHTTRIASLDPDVIVTTGTDAVVFHRVVTH